MESTLKETTVGVLQPITRHQLTSRVTGPELHFFHIRKGVLKIGQSVKMPCHRLSMGVACSSLSAPVAVYHCVRKSSSFSLYLWIAYPPHSYRWSHTILAAVIWPEITPVKHLLNRLTKTEYASQHTCNKVNVRALKYKFYNFCFVMNSSRA